ncbi:LapB repeat-containing protein [Listeria monocytogenes]|nr:LapB repeat-containing protein [Listeria monocytogenes]
MTRNSKTHFIKARHLKQLKNGIITITSLTMIASASPLPVLAAEEVIKEQILQEEKTTEEALKESSSTKVTKEINEKTIPDITKVPKAPSQKVSLKGNANSTIIPESAWEGANWLSSLTAQQIGKSANTLTYEDLASITTLHYSAPAKTYVRLPAIIGNYSNLVNLNLSGLEGAIPEELTAISTLDKLSLTNGRLTGFIPISLQRMDSLTQIDFSNNALSGDYKEMEEIFKSKATLTDNFFDNAEAQQSISYKGKDALGDINLNEGTVILNADGSENATKTANLQNNLQYSTSNEASISGSRGNYTLSLKDEVPFTLYIGLERITSGQAFTSKEIVPDTKPGIVIGKAQANEFTGVPTVSEVVAAFEATAYDNKDGDITGRINIDGLDEIDSSKSASYKLQMTVTDNDGNQSNPAPITINIVAEDAIPFELWQVTIDENGNITGGDGANFSKAVLSQVNAGLGTPKKISQVTQADAKAITTISFSGNTYSPGGAIPKAVGQFANLQELWLNSYGHGSLPAEMKGLTKLKTLTLQGTYNQNGRPGLDDPHNVIETLNGLEYLTITEANGSAGFTITNYPTNLTKLKSFVIKNVGGWSSPVKIKGSTNNFQHFTQVTDMNLTGDLSALKIDEQLYKLPVIQNLKISSDDIFAGRTTFQGEITSDITQLTTLKKLELNGLSQFTGKPLPDYLGTIPNLTALDLSGNGFIGTVPTSYNHFASLNMNYNYLSGDFAALNSTSTRTFNANLLDNAPASTNQSEIIVTRNNVANNSWSLGSSASYAVSFVGVNQSYHTKFMNGMYRTSNKDSHTNASVANTSTVSLQPLSVGESTFVVSVLGAPATSENDTMSQKTIQGVVSEALPEIHYDTNKLNIALEKGTSAPTVGEIMEKLGITSTSGNEDISQYTQISGVTSFSDLDMTTVNTKGYEFTLTATTASGVEGDTVKIRIFITDNSPDSLIPVSSWEEQQPLINKVTTLTGKSIETVTYQDLVNCTELNLANSGMTKFPDILGSFLSLKTLNLSGNRDLADTIPASTGNLHDLQWIYLSNTAISGKIPDEMQALDKLRVAGIENTLINDYMREFSSAFSTAIRAYNDDYYEKSFLIDSTSSWYLETGSAKTFEVNQDIDLFQEGVVEAVFNETTTTSISDLTKFSKYMNIEILQGNAHVVKGADGLQKIHPNGEGSITARVSVPNSDITALLNENKHTTIIVNFKIADVKPPVITVDREQLEITTGARPLNSNDFISLFGISVRDAADGNLTYAANTSYTPSFNNTTGQYTITIESEDYEGNKASKVVKLVDKGKPVIKTDISNQTISISDAPATLSSSDILDLFGVTVSDNLDPNIAKSLSVTGEENYEGSIGTYVFTVSATDVSGNTSSRDLVLNVTDDDVPELSVDTSKLTYELGGDELSEESTIEDFTTYIDLIMKDNVASDETLEANLTVKGFEEIDFTTPGEYPIILKTSDDSENIGSLEVNFTIEDTVNPTLTAKKQRWNQSFDENKSYTADDFAKAAGIVVADADKKAGYVIDEVDLDALNTAIQSNDAVKAGEYTVQITATDSSGNAATPMNITVNVQDMEAPILESDDKYILTQYSELPTADALKEEIQATVTDKVDKTLSVEDIQVIGLDNIDTEIAGTYTITLSVIDNSNNQAERTVTVTILEQPVITADKTISYTENSPVTEEEFLKDSHVKTSDESPVTSDFDSIVDFSTPGVYTVTLNSESTDGVKATPAKVTVTILEQPVITADKTISYTENSSVTEEEFLKDSHVKTSDESPVTSDFDSIVDFSTPGVYTVTLNSESTDGAKAAPAKVTVTILEQPVITADKTISYTENSPVTEEEFLKDSHVKTSDESPVTSDFDSIVDFSTPGVYTVTLNSESTDGVKATPAKVTVTILEQPVITADKTISYTENSSVTEEEFLKDSHVKTSDESPVTSDFDNRTDLTKVGTYKVTLNARSSEGIEAEPITILVNVVASTEPPTPPSSNDPTPNPNNPIIHETNDGPVLSDSSPVIKTTSKKEILPDTGDSSQVSTTLIGIFLIGIAIVFFRKRKNS